VCAAGNARALAAAHSARRSRPLLSMHVSMLCRRWSVPELPAATGVCRWSLP
jgi:hypothetical protein